MVGSNEVFYLSSLKVENGYNKNAKIYRRGSFLTLKQNLCF